MIPSSKACEYLESHLAKYGLEWRNKGRKSDNWKAKIFEQRATGRQIGIYDQTTTIVRLEDEIPVISGVLRLPRCPKGSSFDVSFSRFKNGAGHCYQVETERALADLLHVYFAPHAELNAFDVGRKYSRKDIRVALEMDPEEQGGKVDTGYFSHGGAHFILCMVGGAGRTGHDYQNEFDGAVLKWSGRTHSEISHPSIQRLLAPKSVVHVFYRRNDRDFFTYAGLATPGEVRDHVPVLVEWHFGIAGDIPVESSPQEVGGLSFFEGARTMVWVNKYERNPAARDACIEHFGAKCKCCEIDFSAVYGKVGEGFIHVHHLKKVSEIGSEYEVDPIFDLVPVCPNCHSMIHRRKDPYTVEEVRQMIVAAGIGMTV